MLKGFVKAIAIVAIAYDIGFKDPANFSHAFRH
jgi:AraC-like DNA-binding protein